MYDDVSVGIMSNLCKIMVTQAAHTIVNPAFEKQMSQPYRLHINIPFLQTRDICVKVTGITLTS